MRIILFQVAFYCCISFASKAQEVVFSAPFKNEKFKQYEIIGKKGDDFLILAADLKTEKKKIQVFDGQMQKKQEIVLQDLPDNSFNLSFIPYKNSLTVIYQYYRTDTVFCIGFLLDSNLNRTSPLVVLDFTTDQQAEINLSYSKDKTKLLVYRINYRNREALLSTRIYDTKLQQQHNTSSPLTMDPATEILHSFNIANDGTVYCLIFPKDNKGKGRIKNFEVVYNVFKTAAYNSLLVQVTNKYISTNPGVEINNIDNSLLVSTFYYTTDNTDAITGLFTATVNGLSHKVTSIFNPLGNNILSQLNKKYEKVVEGKNILVKSVIPQNNGGFVITAEVMLDLILRNANGTQYSNYVITNPRIIYDPGYQTNLNYPNYYGDAGNFPDPMNPGKQADPGVIVKNYVYDDIIVAYFNDSMKLSNSFVIPKDQQHRFLSADKLSFLTLNNGREINILFNTGNVRNNQVYNKNFSLAGESSSRPTLKINDDRYILIPLYSKQVAISQALLAFSYRGKLVFGRFDF